jgi:hypothetical protein
MNAVQPSMPTLPGTLLCLFTSLLLSSGSLRAETPALRPGTGGEMLAPTDPSAAAVEAAQSQAEALQDALEKREEAAEAEATERDSATETETAPYTENPEAAAGLEEETKVEVLPVPEVEMPSTAGAAEPLRLSSPEEGSPTANVTINLINKLVEKGILTRDEARAMIAQAEAEADIARQESQMQMVEIAQVIAVDVVAEQLAFEDSMPQPGADDVRVTYVPEFVKQEIRELVGYDVVERARAEGWGQGPTVPAWVNRVAPFADMRFRYQGVFFPDGNNTSGAFPNFNAINNGPPFDVTGNIFSPQLNTDQNRTQFLTRVRFGAMLDIGDNFAMGLRVGTGNNNSPVSLNQGTGNPGYFTKYNLWLDRAFLVYELAETPGRSVRAVVGRADSPFFSTELIFDNDLGFDGIGLQAQYQVTDWLTPFLNAGAFPVFNTELNFATNNPEKFPSYDKYLFGIQGGTKVKIGSDFELKTALAYYHFQNIEGKLSDPIVINNASDAGPTDNSRPSFAQKGNTYMALRNIIPDANNDFGTRNQFQYFGLATPFRNLVFTGQLDWNRFDPIQVSLIGEFVVNTAWNSGDINAVAVNNRGPLADDDFSDTLGSYVGTNTAWNVELKLGMPKLQKAWDWSVGFGYRYIGSDAVVDSFNDSNFGLGGTNMEGYTISGLVALTPNVWLRARWFGASSIAGPTYKNDLFQFDINAKF